jgi:hypothetical protein
MAQINRHSESLYRAGNLHWSKARECVTIPAVDLQLGSPVGHELIAAGPRGTIVEAHMLLTFRRSVLAALAVSCALPAADAAAAVPQPAGLVCVPILATGAGQDLGGGVTEATISAGKIALGRTSASFTTTGVSGTVASFAGPIVFTSRAGTLTAQATGSLDTTTGDFRTTSANLTGTGLLRGTTGDVTLVGTENLTTGAFTETITGRLCEPLR